MSHDHLKPLTKPDYHHLPLTVADMHETDDGHTVVLFHEKPMVMTVSHKLKSKDEHLAKLAEAKETGDPIIVRHHSHNGSVNHVKHMTEEEKEHFRSKVLILPKPGRLRAIDVGSIDPTKFNLVPGSLKSKAFLDNTKIVRGFEKAKKIFDFCLQQSCTVSKNPAVKPCIPIQYLEDGCFARAHKIREIMNAEFKYDCEKVFGYAKQPPNYLSVRADMWGGCCIRFWYHVAPLVRVRVDANTTVAMVFDPSVFTRPVLLSTWMMGLENPGCFNGGKMSDFCIQPGRAYAPTKDGDYMLDPTYRLTDEILKKYAKLKSCGKDAKQVVVNRRIAKKPK